MKKVLSLFLILCTIVTLVTTAPVIAETSGKCGENVTWIYENGTLTISGTGDMWDYIRMNEAPWYEYHDTIKTAVIQAGVTSIGNWAFWDCNNLVYIDIPSSISSIGERSFYKCYSLTTVKISGAVENIATDAFYYCSKLSRIDVDVNNACYSSINGNLYNKNKTTLIQYATGKNDRSFEVPNNVTSIDDQAFCGCSELINVIIPDSVASIGYWSFRDCSGLTSINVDENNKKYCSYDGVLFNKNMTTLIQYPPAKANSEYVIPDSVMCIEDSAFFECTELTSITIPNSVTSIGDYAFYGCTGLTSVTIPDSVTSIGGSAFYGCTGLASVNISNSVTSINDLAFYGCTGLTSVIIPDSVKTISFFSFAFCSELEFVEIGSGTNRMEYAFYHCKKIKNIYVNSNNIVYSSLDGSLYNRQKTILFKYASGRQDKFFETPSSVTDISDDAFSDSYNLEVLQISDNVKYVGTGAFRGCKGLKTVHIGRNVNGLDGLMFYGCENLVNIYVDNTNQRYKSIDGILCNENKTELIKYAGGRQNKTYDIPDSIQSISGYAFCDSINLVGISLPSSINTIDMVAFFGCENLSDVWYDGTEEEKEKINIQGNNKSLLSARWHYNGMRQVNIPNYEKGGDVIVAIYDSDDKLISVNSYTPAEYINASYGRYGVYMKVMQWEAGTMKPLALEQRIDL